MKGKPHAKLPRSDDDDGSGVGVGERDLGDVRRQGGHHGGDVHLHCGIRLFDVYKTARGLNRNEWAAVMLCVLGGLVVTGWSALMGHGEWYVGVVVGLLCYFVALWAIREERCADREEERHDA